MYNVVNMREDPLQKQGLINLCEYLSKHIDISQSNLLEIGCYQGESSEIFAERFKSITCVDLWENNPEYMDDATNSFPMTEVESNFDERMSKFGNVVKIKGDFQKLNIDYPYDVVYLDANHEYDNVLHDIMQIVSFDTIPKFICGHDYTQGWPGVIKVVNELLGGPNVVFSDNSWVVKVDLI